jgi:hypothetical protein
MTEATSRLKVSAFVMPKRGSSPKECEDSVGVARSRMRFCVADGATEAFDSRYWARLLTKCWSLRPAAVISPQQFAGWLPTVGDRFDSRWEGKKLPWYSEEKSRAGAFAAFAGLIFESDGQDFRWAAAVLGDSCLFRLTADGALSGTIPDVSQAAFNYRPTLIPSRRSLQSHALSQMLFGAGEVSEGDVFFLLTDAIAAWYARILKEDPALARRFDTMASGSCHPQMEDLIHRERERGTLHNDDIAAIRIEYTGESGGPPPKSFGK